MSRVLIVGCGYTGRRLARRLRDDGHEVAGTTRDPQKAASLRAEEIRPLLLDLEERDAAERLAEEAAPDVCFYLVPPLGRNPDDAETEEGGGTEEETAGARTPIEGGADRPTAVARAAAALRRSPLEAFVYASSTSVYGDRGGERVDETAPPAPDSPAGEARLEAEQSILSGAEASGPRPRIGRIAGIYGPGRTLESAIAAGRYHLIEGVDAWSNRIHVADLVTALVALWRRGADGRVYNLCDDEPHRSADFARRVAELADLELRTIGLEEARRRYPAARLARKLGSKRVSNRRLREELGVELRYPTYREGLAALFEERAEEAEA